MSFITRCPACGTTFKVVADQLKISDGWVRCGHCADVFDATLTLQNWGPSSEPAGFSPDPPQRFLKPSLVQAEPVHAAVDLTRAAAPAPPHAPVDGTSANPVGRPPAQHHSATGGDVAAAAVASGGRPEEARTGETHPSEGQAPETGAADSRGHGDKGHGDKSERALTAGIRAVESPAADTSQLPQAGPAPAHTPDGLSGAGDSATEGTPRAPSRPGRSDAPFEVDPDDDFDPFDDADKVSTPPAPAPVSGTEAPGHDSTMPVPEPGFVRQARRHAFWRSRGVRTSIWALNGVLAVLLVLQWAVYQRDRLAARHEALAPWLNTLCKPLGCTVQPARQVDALAIDSSKLLRRLGSFYSFEFVLKNSAGMPVAMPALELSLTNLRDEVIVRRVFLPRELPEAPPTVPAEGTVQLDLRLSLSDQDASAMTGYRALVFYP